jgi:D-glycero-beta-D-manno-heptose-7-phosphate kinase
MSSPLAGLVARLPGSRIVVVGDAMLDEYIWGEVRRISPEAPVPVVEVRGRTHVPGGAGNVAAGIVALEGHARLGAVAGADGPGEDLRRSLEERGVDCGGLLVDQSRETTTKTRVIAHSQQVVRTDSEARAPLDAEVEDRLLAWVEEAIGTADAVVISDYAKSVVSERVSKRVIELARERGAPAVVDPKGVDYAKYRGATVLTPNVHDAKRAANLPAELHADLSEVGRRLVEVLPGSLLLITRGAEGMSLLSESGRLDVRADAQAVYDVTGAGDTVVAMLAVALGAGIEVEDAVRLANAAAGIVVSKVGTASVTLDELRALRPAEMPVANPGGAPARRLDSPPVAD